MQGACVFGMTAALYSGITLENGAVVESNFHDYEMVRADAFPQVVHTHIVEHPFAVHATGVGEPGVPPFLPALTNAIFHAHGKRIRDLPTRTPLRSEETSRGTECVSQSGTRWRPGNQNN